MNARSNITGAYAVNQRKLNSFNSILLIHLTSIFYFILEITLSKSIIF